MPAAAGATAGPTGERPFADDAGRRNQHGSAQTERAIDATRDVLPHRFGRIGRVSIGLDELAQIGRQEGVVRRAHRPLCLAWMRRTAAMNCSRPVRSR